MIPFLAGIQEVGGCIFSMHRNPAYILYGKESQSFYHNPGGCSFLDLEDYYRAEPAYVGQQKRPDALQKEFIMKSDSN